MKISLDPSTSAQASAKERKIVLRAGTYVMGMPCAHLVRRAALGNRDVAGERRAAKDAQIDGRNPVLRHADGCGHARWPPPAPRCAAGHRRTKAHTARSPGSRAMASTVAESSPPLSSTTALFACVVEHAHCHAYSHVLRLCRYPSTAESDCPRRCRPRCTCRARPWLRG